MGKLIILVLSVGKFNLPLDLVRRTVKSYSWQLAMHVIQAAYNAVTSVSYHLRQNPDFMEYATTLRHGLREVARCVDMPLPLLEQIITCRCEELDAVVAFVVSI